MRSLVRLVICLSFFYTYSVSAGNKKISNTEKYSLYFQTWNFLKYYHPAFTTGKINADSVFLLHVSSLSSIHTSESFNGMILNIINSLGSNNFEATVVHEASGRKPPKANWYLSNHIISHQIKQQLGDIYWRRDGTAAYYMPVKSYTAEIPNEKVYSYAKTVNIPMDMRLLALAKLYGVIEYLDPHHSLIKNNWTALVEKQIPLFIACSSRQEYELLLLNIVAQLHDTHAFNRFYNSLAYRKEIFKNSYYPPFDYVLLKDKIIVTRLIISELCQKANIEVGDVIEKINQEPVRNRVDKLSTLLSASNRSVLVHKVGDYATNFIWFADSAVYRLQTKKRGAVKQLTVQFAMQTDKAKISRVQQYLDQKNRQNDTIRGFSILEGSIAYFNIDHISTLLTNVPDVQLDTKIDSILTLAVSQKGIIFDMRGYPSWGGFVYHYIFKKFGTAGSRFANYYMADRHNPGHFTLDNSSSTYIPDHIVPQQTPYKGKIYILVNSATQSMSEWNTMNLQHTFPSSITIGEQTAGADGDEKSLNLPGNYKIYFTGNAIFYPEGRAAQGKGVKIDKVIPTAIDDIIAGSDTQLDFAVREIRR
jgi:C-terminal processing protease CtpA/Prc